MTHQDSGCNLDDRGKRDALASWSARTLGVAVFACTIDHQCHGVMCGPHAQTKLQKLCLRFGLSSSRTRRRQRVPRIYNQIQCWVLEELMIGYVQYKLVLHVHVHELVLQLSNIIPTCHQHHTTNHGILSRILVRPMAMQFSTKISARLEKIVCQHHSGVQDLLLDYKWRG